MYGWMMGGWTDDGKDAWKMGRGVDGWMERRKGGKREGQGREMGFLIYPFNKYLNIDCEPVTVLRAGRKRSSEQERQRCCSVFITIICMLYIVTEK